ncbi:MAG: HAMP domain-containing histidine kinase [Marinilabiliaceae bacterium]|nr:HAMP domain-containing histidine kinase [Marinilabiliaceae bacterium]
MKSVRIQYLLLLFSFITISVYGWGQGELSVYRADESTTFIEESWDAVRDSSSADKILIITAYSPEVPMVSRFISEFMQRFAGLGSDFSIMIENLNSHDLSKFSQWRTRMINIFKDCDDDNNRPRLVILIGQETWATYLSINTTLGSKLPVIPVDASRHILKFTADDDGYVLSEPSYIDFNDVSPMYYIVGGALYQYNLEKNIELIRTIYPSTENIVFLNDNSYGGLALQRFVQREMGKFPELRFTFIDGRKLSKDDVIAELQSQPANSALLVGTWRLDSDGRVYLQNSIKSVFESVPDMPKFTISSSGLGHGVIGGYVPDYDNRGAEVAEQAYSFLKGKESGRGSVMLVGSHYVFDKKVIDDLPETDGLIPSGAQLYNDEESIYSTYKTEIIIILLVFFVLIALVIAAVLMNTRMSVMAKKLEEHGRDLVKAKLRAEESSRLKSAFLANVSHEIRTPLNAIVGFSDVIATDETLTAEDKKSIVSVIKTNSDMLLDLINNILDLSRLESGKVKYNMEDVEVIEVYKEAILTVKGACTKELYFFLDTMLDFVNIRLDRQRLQQVILNLLTNAVKYTDEGGVTVTVKYSDDQKKLITMVTDTGVGIPVDKFERVFERFEKLDDSKQGTGLGLSMCKAIVEHFGGEIWLDSTYEKGARFIFSLPIEGDGSSRDKEESEESYF